MERYISIDNVCAWPNLTRMPDGAIIASIFNQPTHGGWEGDVECWASVDGGRMWTLRGVAAPHEPKTNRMNVAAGLAQDGSLIVIASGWSKRNPVGIYSSPDGEGEVLPAWVCRSRDGGRTWSHSESIGPPDEAPSIVPFGDIVRTSDGALGVSVYGWDGSNGGSFWYASGDNGLTWDIRGIVSPVDTNETDPVVLSDGTVLAAARTAGDAHLELYRSTDHGVNWENIGTLTLAGQHPAHLCELADGRVLLTYGIRNNGCSAIGARISEDAGVTWGHPRVLVHFNESLDHGYPSSVEEDDGTIVTAWYSGGFPEHRRYHMGVGRWTLDE
jgi:hypothetical protein